MLMKQMMLLCGGDCDSDGGTDMVLQTLLTLVALVPTTLVPVLLSLPALVSGLGSLQRLVSRLLELTMVSRLLELTLGSALTTLRSPLALVHLTPVLLPLVRTLVTKTLAFLLLGLLALVWPTTLARRTLVSLALSK
jgi:hypothetical protein